MKQVTDNPRVFFEDPDWQWHGKSYIALEYNLQAERELREIRESNKRLERARGK